MTLKAADESSVQPLWLIQAKSQRWDEKLARTVLEQQRLSGLSQSRFCQRFGLGLHRLTWWKSKLAESAETPRIVPIRIVEPQTTQSLDAPKNGSPLELVLSGGRLIRVGSDFDADTLRRLLAVLEGPKQC